MSSLIFSSFAKINAKKVKLLHYLTPLRWLAKRATMDETPDGLEFDGAFQGASQQLDAIFHIAQVNCLAGGVDVAARDGNHA